MPRKEPHWTRIYFKDFIRHFRKLDKDQIYSDVMESMDALEDNDPSKDCFGSKMVQWSIERIEKNRAKGIENWAKGNSDKPSSQVVKAPDQLTYGKMANVYMTQDEFNDLATQVGNLNEANSLIDNLSCKLADGSFQSDNHFATLCYWASYRKEKSEQQSGPIQSRYETVGEHNMRVMNEIFHRIDSQKKERENGRLG